VFPTLTRLWLLSTSSFPLDTPFTNSETFTEVQSVLGLTTGGVQPRMSRHIYLYPSGRMTDGGFEPDVIRPDDVRQMWDPIRTVKKKKLSRQWRDKEVQSNPKLENRTEENRTEVQPIKYCTEVLSGLTWGPVTDDSAYLPIHIRPHDGWVVRATYTLPVG
jgi:hypothetical protein